MKRAVAGQVHIHGREQDREFVLVEVVLVAAFVAVVEQVPAVRSFDQRQLLQRARGILPGEKEKRPGSVVHGADIDA